LNSWIQIADHFAGQYVPGDFFVREHLLVSIPPWQVRVEVEPTSLIPMTRVSAECTLRRAFCFRLERTNRGTELATSHPLFAESLLALPGYREALLSERFVLELGPGLLWCDTYGIVTEQARLIRLIEIVAETLQRLRDLRVIDG
jgi:hypothetical protein